jgi:hypothetical protein
VTQQPGPPRYRPRCLTCPWTGRERSRYSYAAEAAKDHTGTTGHLAFVLDHYGLRVVGSTTYPDPERNARP